MDLGQALVGAFHDRAFCFCRMEDGDGDGYSIGPGERILCSIEGQNLIYPGIMGRHVRIFLWDLFLLRTEKN